MECLITVADDDKQEGLKIAKRFSAIGYGIYATKGTAQYLSSNGIYVKTVDKVKEETDNNVIDVIRKGRVNYVVNTMSISSEVNRDALKSAVLPLRITSAASRHWIPPMRFCACWNPKPLQPFP